MENDLDEGDGASVGVLVVLELLSEPLDVECRIEGESKDSRAFGSSSLVYLPIEGLCVTCITKVVSFRPLG